MKTNHLYIILLTASVCFFCPEAIANDTIRFQLLSEERTFPSLPQTIVYDQLDRSYYYVAAKTGGVLVFDGTDLENPDLVKTIPITDMDGLEAMNAVQVDNFLYVALGNFFGSNPQNPGVAIIDVQNPESPTVRDIWKADTIQNGSAIVIVEEDYAYLGAMNDGLIILDISDKNDIQFVSQYIPDKDFPIENPNDVQEPNARGMDLADNKLFLCYDAGGIRVINVEDKTMPFEEGRYINEEALNTQQAYNNITLNGDIAYVAIDYCGMEILDISNTNDIKRLSWWNPWECETPANVWFNSPGHTNQLEYVKEQDLVFLSAGGSELLVVDVSDPMQPRQVGQFGEEGNQLGVWGAEVHGSNVFLSYINAIIPFVGNWSGVKVLSWENLITNTENLIPEEENNLKAWPNPFLKSTNIYFNLKRNAVVGMQIFDNSGKQITTIKEQAYPAGDHQIIWDGQDDSGKKVNPGIYFYQLSIGGVSITKKIIKL